MNAPRPVTPQPWPDAWDSHKAAALALLMSGADLAEKEGQFCGGIMFRPADMMTDKQWRWLSILLRRHHLPPLAGDGR